METYPEVFSIQKSPRKLERKRHRVLFKDLCSDFTNNTTLHGLKYINESGLTIVEKIFWLVIFMASLAYCGYQIRNVWFKWYERPVIVSFSEKMVPVGMVPFPSVTICPQRKISRKKFNISAACENNDTLDAYKLDDVTLLCGAQLMCKDPLERKNANETMVEHFFEAIHDTQDIFIICVWRRHYYSDCDKFFNRVLTKEGVCYNFNSIPAKEIFRNNSIQYKYNYLEAADDNVTTTGWSLEKGYIDGVDNPYPKRGRQNGAEPDLQVVLLSNTEKDEPGCNTLNDGFKIYVHHPTDFPHASLYYYAALFGQITSLALKFNMISTSDALNSYAPDVRQCYFQDNKPLKYFKVYTQKNCFLECSANHTFSLCGCVAYYMPHGNADDICPYHKFWCVDKAIDNMAALELSGKGGECACLPACDSVTYDAEILKTKYDFKRYMKQTAKMAKDESWDMVMERYKSCRVSAIEMYFKEPQYVSMRRSELFGVTDFISNCGGLLSLFLGFSILSLVEILYYVTLRFYCILRREAKEELVHDKNEKQP